MRIAPGRGKRLKTPAAPRLVPLHPLLFDLGLVEQARRELASGTRRLFPEIERGGPFKLFGYRLSKNFTDYRRALGLYEPRKDSHSLRHSFSTHLARRQLPANIIGQLVGHAPQGDTDRRYNKGLLPSHLVAVVASIDYGLRFERGQGEIEPPSAIAPG